MYALDALAPRPVVYDQEQGKGLGGTGYRVQQTEFNSP